MVSVLQEIPEAHEQALVFTLVFIQGNDFVDSPDSIPSKDKPREVSTLVGGRAFGSSARPPAVGCGTRLGWLHCAPLRGEGRERGADDSGHEESPPEGTSERAAGTEPTLPPRAKAHPVGDAPEACADFPLKRWSEGQGGKEHSPPPRKRGSPQAKPRSAGQVRTMGHNGRRKCQDVKEVDKEVRIKALKRGRYRDDGGESIDPVRCTVHGWVFLLSIQHGARMGVTFDLITVQAKEESNQNLRGVRTCYGDAHKEGGTSSLMIGQATAWGGSQTSFWGSTGSNSMVSV
ncbi:hypothetical protein C8J57DRAFT_1229633 [Mycena rebaudengoi]|nr:hypothetical protein C8J57DRAFT_1229633 [Mycena rebaudengoi]